MVDNKYVLGIDIGGTKIRLGIVDFDGNVKWAVSKPNYNFNSMSEWIQYFIDNILTQIPDEYTTSYAKIGIGTAGWIDEESNLIIHSPNTNWKNVDLKSLLEKEINIPITIINDCSAAVIGEHAYGAIKDCTNALGIFIGTGIGGGIILNNNLYQGSQGFAGEIGHTIIVEDGNLCECGRKGCLEAYCGGKAIGKIAKNIASIDKNSVFNLLAAKTNKQISAETVSMAYYENNEEAVDIIKEISNKLAISITNFFNIFDPEAVVIGGGVIDGIPEIVNYIDNYFKDLSITENKHNKIRKGKLNENMVLVGASIVARNLI
ncbi:MAG: ROK family protein [SAR202 cluster bacterium]|nr:hypothetical protein [Chloroflexota bacterium]MQG51566.1 ROK family protein [SAR202 cluster bacterium]